MNQLTIKTKIYKQPNIISVLIIKGTIQDISSIRANIELINLLIFIHNNCNFYFFNNFFILANIHMLIMIFLIILKLFSLLLYLAEAQNFTNSQFI